MKQIEKIAEHLKGRLFNNQAYQKLEQCLNENLEWEELNPIKNEIVNCLMLGFDFAGITLTNFFLERIMKLALIYDEAGFIMISDVSNLTAYEEPIKRYDNMNLHATIDNCSKKEIISSETEEKLTKYRDRVRNGFSHATSEKIFKNNTARFITGNFLTGEMSAAKEVQISKIHPSIQAHALNEFVEQNAIPYFELVFSTAIEVQTNVNKKHKK